MKKILGVKAKENSRLTGFASTEVQGISFVGSTGARTANLACGTYKTYALSLRRAVALGSECSAPGICFFFCVGKIAH